MDFNLIKQYGVRLILFAIIGSLALCIALSVVRAGFNHLNRMDDPDTSFRPGLVQTI